MRLIVFLFALLVSGAVFAAPEAALPAATTHGIHQDVVHATGEVDAIEDAATHEEHAGAEEHHAAGPPQFAVDTFPSQIFWLTVTFATLYLLMSGAALPRIEQGMKARAAHIHNLLADARRVHDDAESHKNDMNSASDSAHQTAHDLLNKAAVESQDIANRRNHELEAVLQTKIKASEDRIATARANAVQSVREASQILLPTVLQKVAQMQLSEKQIADLVQNVEAPETNGGSQPRRGAA